MNYSSTAFHEQYPTYADTTELDKLRAIDFKLLDDTNEVYLDYTGGGLYSTSQVAAHTKILQNTLFGNPHSDNPSSIRATKIMEQARAAVLSFFDASPDDYCVIFTSNASGALRLVGEAYPFRLTGQFLQLIDNHNSVNGIREFARQAGSSISLIKSQRDDLQVRTEDVMTALRNHQKGSRLFAYPAQSNFSGVQHSLDWIALAQSEGWDVLLDAAAFVPTNKLSFSLIKPDFVCLSFYKMFGWPTGIGCLIAKRSSLPKLKRPWFSGGTVQALSVQGDWHIMANEYEAFEDGTVNYLNAPAITLGLDYLQKIGIETIHTRVMCLTDWVLMQLKTLRHSNGRPLIEIYGPLTTQNRGAVITLNFLTPGGQIVDERIVSREAKKYRISLRTGCFCNPGAAEIAFNLPPEKLAVGRSNSNGNGNGQSFDHYLALMELQSGNAIRISFGLASNFNDAKAFLEFAHTFRDTHFSTQDLPKRVHC